MDVVCNNCGAIYELDPSQIKSDSVRVKCSSCAHVFRVFKPTDAASASAAAPAPAPNPTNNPATQAMIQPWYVRYKDGVIARVPDQATLQRWIVERKIDANDQLSRDESTWMRADAFAELKPFFLVVNQSSPALQAATGATPAFSPSSSTLSPPSQRLGIQNSGQVNRQTLEFGLTASDIQAAVAQRQIQQASAEQVTEYQVTAAPSSDNQPTEFAMPGVSEMQGISEAQLDAPAKPAGPAYTNDLTKASPSSSGEWFMGNQQEGGEVPKVDEPGFGSFDNQQGFGRDAGFTDDDYLDDDDFRPPSSKGKWFGLLLFLLLVGGGFAYIANPELLDVLMVQFGQAEATPTMLKRVAKVAETSNSFHKKSFDKAQKELDVIEKDAGKLFPTLRAQTLELNLKRVEHELFEQQVTKRQLAQVKAKAVANTAQLKKLTEEKVKADDPKWVAAQTQKRALEAQQRTLERTLTAQGTAYKTLWQRAQKQLQELRDKHDDHPAVRLAAMHYFALGKGKSEAYENQRKALLQKPEAQAWDARIKEINMLYALRNNKLANAQELLNTLLGKDGDNIYLHFSLLQLALNRENTAAAKQIATKIAQLDSTHPLAKKYKALFATPVAPQVAAKTSGTAPGQAGNAPNGKRPAPRRRASQPLTAQSYRSLYRGGRRYYRRGSYRRALKYYKAALKKRSTPSAYAGMGWCYLELEKVRSAKSAFQKSMKLSSRYAEAYMGLGSVYRRLGDKSKARSMYRIYLDKFPNGRDAGEVRLILRNL